MSRQWIEFVQSQRLPMVDGDLGLFTRSVTSRVLSIDPDDGSASLLLRLRDGDDLPQVDSLRDEELLVTAGSLRSERGDWDLGRMQYRCRAAGDAQRPRLVAVGPTVVLVFIGASKNRVVRHFGVVSEPAIDLVRAPWQSTFTPGLTPGAARKDLRVDPHDGSQTWLLGTLPMRFGTRAEWHPVVEEMVLLAGNLSGPLGTMYPGAYFWRPPNELHGPFRSETGTLLFFRTVGGPLETTFEDVGDGTAAAPIVPASVAARLDPSWRPDPGAWERFAQDDAEHLGDVR